MAIKLSNIKWDKSTFDNVKYIAFDDRMLHNMSFIDVYDMGFNGKFKRVSIGNRYTFYISYDTCVAFTDDSGLVVSENVWSKTTGRHLNDIDPNKDKRIPHGEFSERLEAWENELIRKLNYDMVVKIEEVEKEVI